MNEIWRDVIGYEGLYQVSNLGRVKSFYNGGRIMKLSSSNNGYLHVGLCRDNKRKTRKVHRLVAEAFIPNPESKREVNHINGDKTDNRAENLEWCTPSENMQHAIVTGLVKQNGEDSHNAKLTNEQACFIRKNPDGLTVTELATKFAVCLQTISNIQRGISYKAAGGSSRQSKHPPRLPIELQEQIRREFVPYSREFGASSLSKKYGTSESVIWRIIHEATAEVKPARKGNSPALSRE